MRILLLAVALALAGCSGGSTAKAPAFPEKMEPAWSRSAVQPMDAVKFPAIAKSAGIQQAWQTEYRSPDGAVVRVDAYAVKSNTQGLDLAQRWLKERDNAQFYTDHYLLNVAWQGAKHDELASLVRSLPKLIEQQ
jgi:hypothetical protein